MKIAYLVPGNGGQFYCENCQRDAAQLKALRQAGHEVLSVPLYLPLAPEQLGAQVSPLFFGAVGFYLRESLPLLRRMPQWLRQLADSRPLLALAANQAGTTSARGNEELTLAMLRGDDPVCRSETEAVARWLGGHFQPDIIHVSNILLIGLVPLLKRLVGVPVVITLQDEHTWLDSCRPDKAATAWEVLRRQAAAVDRFLPVSGYYRDFMAGRLGLGPERFAVVRPGIDLEEYPPRDESGLRAIGFLSHWSHAMGFGDLVDAFIRLRRDKAFADVRLLACGGGTSADGAFLRACHGRLKAAGLADALEFRPGFAPPERRRFLAECSILSVPSVNGEAYGSFILEALASGIPVVQPRRGGFVELVEESQGGLLTEPGDIPALAEAFAALLGDGILRRETGLRARRFVAERRNLAAYAKSLVAVYGEVLR